MDFLFKYMRLVLVGLFAAQWLISCSGANSLDSAAPKESSDSPDDEFTQASSSTPTSGINLVDVKAFKDPPPSGYVATLSPTTRVYVVLKNQETGAVISKLIEVDATDLTLANGLKISGQRNYDLTHPYHYSFDVPNASLVPFALGKDSLLGEIKVTSKAFSNKESKTSEVLWLSLVALQAEKTDWGTMMVPVAGASATPLLIQVLVSAYDQAATSVTIIGAEPELAITGGTCPALSSTVSQTLTQNCTLELTPVGTRAFNKIVTLKYNNGVRISHASWPIKGETAVVIGQSSAAVYSNSDSTNPTPTASNLYRATSAYFDGVRLFVLDAGNPLDLTMDSDYHDEDTLCNGRGRGRVLIWNSMPTSSNVPADVVVGQPDFTSSIYGGTNFSRMPVNATNLMCSSAVYSDGTKMFVSNPYFNRVLVWNSIPTSNNNTPADVVIGRNSMTDANICPLLGYCGFSELSNLMRPVSLSSYGGKLFISERNDGVVVYDEIPSENGVSASRIIKTITPSYPDMNYSQFLSPRSVFFDGITSFVTDALWGHVLMGKSANFADLGGSVLLGAENRPYPPTQSSMVWPVSVHASNGIVAAADLRGNRVLLWRSIPTESSANADLIFGQKLPSSTAPNVFGDSLNSLNGPNSVQVIGDKLMIADSINRRVIIRQIPPDASAAVVAEQESFNSGGLTGALLTVTGGNLYNFGTRAPGSAGTYTMSLHYQGTSAISITGITGGTGSSKFSFTGGTFPGTNGNCGLFISGDCTISLGFNPDKVGSFEDVFRITYNNEKGVRDLAIGLSGDARNLAQLIVGQSDAASMLAPGDNVLFRRYASSLATDGSTIAIAQPGMFGRPYWESIELWPSPSAFEGARSESAYAPVNLYTHFDWPRYCDSRPCVPNSGTPILKGNEILFAESKLLVSKRMTGGIYVWNSIPTSDVVNSVNVQDFILRPGDLLKEPTVMAYDGSRLFVADRDKNRILIWNSMPTEDTPADVEISELAIDGLVASGGRLYASVGSTILVWNTIPTVNNTLPSFSIDTQNFGDSSEPHYSQGGGGKISFDGTYFLMSEPSNNRVLIWEGLPTNVARTPYAVLGQKDFVSRVANAEGISASSLNAPSDAISVGGKIYVADKGNYRIMVFPMPPQAALAVGSGSSAP